MEEGLNAVCTLGHAGQSHGSPVCVDQLTPARDRDIAFRVIHGECASFPVLTFSPAGYIMQMCRTPEMSQTGLKGSIKVVNSHSGYCSKLRSAGLDTIHWLCSDLELEILEHGPS